MSASLPRRCLLAFLTLFSLATHAQTDSSLWGTTISGGSNQAGAIFRYDPATNAYQQKFAFDAFHGTEPHAGLTAYNGKLYGTAYRGGDGGWGVLYAFDPTTEAYTILINFGLDGAGEHPGSRLIVANDKLYGFTATDDGDFWNGVLYEFDPATGSYAVLGHCDITTGVGLGTPVYADGAFYAHGYGGDTSSAISYGLLTRFRPETGSFEIAHAFNGSDGTGPIGTPLLYNGKLYGLTIAGGAFDHGVLYEYDLATASFQTHDFNIANGNWARGDLLEMSGRLYGSSSLGGANNTGVLFEFDPATGELVPKVDFEGTPDNSTNSANGDLTACNGKLYFTTLYGGLADSGTLMEYDPVTSVLSKKHDFIVATGSVPNAGLLAFPEATTATPDLPDQPEVARIFPNPAKETVFISSKDQRPAFFRLSDMLGRPVRNLSLTTGNGALDIKALPAGAYHYDVQNAQREVLQRGNLIKE